MEYVKDHDISKQCVEFNDVFKEISRSNNPYKIDLVLKVLANFCIGNYKWTTKRIEDGHRLCDDFMKLIQERADIEKEYAKRLKEWSKKWNSAIKKGPEYGTTEAAWLGVLEEADQRCDLHMDIKDNLLNEVHSSVKAWQKDHYHKTVMRGLKEKTDIEDLFKKAQKQWAKLYEKVQKSKLDFHNACKAERTAQNQERNAGGDSSLSPDQTEYQKPKKRCKKQRRNMNKPWQKLPLIIQSILRIPRTYEELYHTVSNADYEKDLRWWSNKHGVNMPMNWPAFEDYNPDLHRISKKGGKGLVGGVNDDVTLKSINQNKNASPLTTKTSENNRNSAVSSNGVSGEDDEWDYSERLVDPNKPGVPVRALYDYVGVEDDELSFKTGDTFEKLEDQDEQGWCTGRKDGRIGLYPANYFSPRY
ncbi:Protein kinase C and casein kinase substrate in neurons protein 1 [Armadillidium vulgare]|nr:Protein kinase C and casein kinase substrate in neurons protein 1 [Armadillidium vulgare]